MALSQSQLIVLKAAIDADPVLSSKPLSPDGHFDIAKILNEEIVVPDFWVWKTSITINEIMGNGFDWTRVDNMTVGESRIWEYMTQIGTVNPNQANVRDGVNQAFKGTAQDDIMRVAIFGHCQHLATRAQRLYAVGAGTTSNNSGVGPGTVVIESIAPLEVEQARTML